MKFCSVVGKSPRVDFSTALLQGLAPDGGLYAPEYIPKLPQVFIDRVGNMTLQEIGCEVMAQFLHEFPQDVIARIVQTSLTFPIPLIKLDERLFLLELFHGPTLAFKDVGARCMAEILSHVLSRQQKDVTVLVATSGDTGSAVAHGFYGASHVAVFVLYPSGRISRLQEQQMATLGGNIHAIEVEGTFDDCQRLVKQALVDSEILSTRLLTTANSINLARLLPQIVYYVWAYGQWKHIEPASKTPLTVVVPSGNFGNLTAAAYAKRMGAPFRRFIAATNANDVFAKYLQSGTFVPAPSIRTISNAMDVGNPSNLARLQLLYENDLDQIRKDIEAESFSDEETLHQVRLTYQKQGYILDPHTAIGVAAAYKHISLYDDHASYIVAATAHPSKFRETILQAIHHDVPLPQSLRKALSLQKMSIKCGKEYGQFRKLLLSQTPYTT